MKQPTPSARRPARAVPIALSSSGRGEETRVALLAAGRKVFARRGFDGASVRDITREAGVNLGAVTYHFGSKKGLYTAVLTQVLTPMVERVGRASSDPGSPLERIGRVIEVFFEHVSANPDLPRLMLQEVAAGKKPPPELVALVQRNLANVTGIVAAGWKDGSIRAGHPVLTALSVVSQPMYMTVMAPMVREVGGVDLTDPTTRAMAIDHVKAFVRAGLAAPQETSP